MNVLYFENLIYDLLIKIMDWVFSVLRRIGNISEFNGDKSHAMT